MFRLLLVLWLFLSSTFAIKAQCPFDASITPASLNLCPLSSDTLFAGPASSYQWFRNGIPLLNSNQSFWVISAQNDAGASFQVVQTLNDCSEASPSAVVSLVPTPQLSFTVSGADNGILCGGESALLQISSGHSATISWFRNGIQIPGANQTQLSVNQSGNYSVTAAVADCPAFIQFSNPFGLQVIVPEVPVISADQSVEVLNASGGGLSFSWSLNGSVLPEFTGAQISPPQTGVYTVTAFYEGGCNATSAAFVFEGFGPPCTFEATITAPAGLSVCPGDSILLQANGQSNFQWFVDGTALEGANDAQIQLPAELAGSSITLSATEGLCTDVSAAVQFQEATLGVPVITTANNDTVVCEGESLLLSIDGNFMLQSWIQSGKPIGGQLLQLYVTSPGFYSATVVDLQCPDITIETEPINIELAENPMPIISFSGSSLSTEAGAQNYVWFLNGSVVPGLNGNIVLAQNGNWQVEAYYSNGCSALSEVLLVESIGWNLPITRPIQVRPNPADEVLWIDSPGGRMRLLDVLGRIHVDQEVNQGWMTLPFKPESGHYLLVVENAQGLWQQKVVFR